MGLVEFGCGLLWAALVTGAEPSPHGGHPRTLDADVHAQVTGIDLNTLSSQPEEPEAGTHMQTSSAEPDPLVGQPDGPNQGEDAHLANAYSEGLMDALEDWLVEVEEVKVEAADETVRAQVLVLTRKHSGPCTLPFHPKPSQLPTHCYPHVPYQRWPTCKVPQSAMRRHALPESKTTALTWSRHRTVYYHPIEL
jgi:hypothetical protein